MTTEDTGIQKALTPEQRMAKLAVAATAFSPSAPIDQQALFAGRLLQLTDVVNAVSQKGQHVVLFGERGVGKTSLARTISAMYAQVPNVLIVAPINCDPSTTFSSMWHNAMRTVVLTRSTKALSGFTAEPSSETVGLGDMLPVNVSPDDVRHVLGQFGKTIIIFDELDRVEDSKATSLLADTIKTLSDHAVDTTLILVGVADSVEALIAEHQSIERALVQIRMPRMSTAELLEIIDKGMAKTEMTIDPIAKSKIAALSQGLPHYTHLLSLHAAQRAITDTRVHVTGADVTAAIDKALTQAQHSIISAYHRATNSPRENLYPQVLLACALAHVDGLGYFAASDVREPMARIMGRPYDIPAFSQHLNAFCESARGPILQRIGETRRFRFRFVNPLMQPYVTMDGLRRGLIPEGTMP